MSHLIQLKQRIKVVETIKKTTNAMRLISMSTHSRLRQKKKFLEDYRTKIESLYQNLRGKTESLGAEPHGNRKLVIIVGSQKGLCGTFNTHLLDFFSKDMSVIHEQVDIIAIGKQIIDYFKMQRTQLTSTFPDFNSTTFVTIGQAITTMLINDKRYATALVYANTPLTFFIQKSQKTQIFPITIPTSSEPSHIEYLWEQPHHEIALNVENLWLKASLEMLLYESLLAEQSARFVSMDASTRNAEDLLTTMKLDYNKLRQALITRELTDLTASF